MKKMRGLVALAALLFLGPAYTYAACTTTVPDRSKLDMLQGLHDFESAYAVGQAYRAGERIIASGNVYELTTAFTGTGLSVTSPTGTTTATDNGGTWTYRWAAPVYKLVIIKSGMAGTYGAASLYYSEITTNSDEVGNSGTYTAGGVTLATPVTSIASNHAYIDWADISITTATISGACAAIIDTTHGNRIVSIHDFGGTVASTGGTFAITITNPLAIN